MPSDDVDQLGEQKSLWKYGWVLEPLSSQCGTIGFVILLVLMLGERWWEFLFGLAAVLMASGVILTIAAARYRQVRSERGRQQ